MHISLKRGLVAVAGFALLATSSIFASSTWAAPGATGEDQFSAYLSGQASTLLSKIQDEAADLSPHADTLDVLARSPRLSWETHAHYLNRVKGHINSVGKHLAELQQVQTHVAPWQKQAIAELTNHVTQMANRTEAAIVHLRENQNRLFVQEYRDHLSTIADRSEMMKETVDKFLDFERTQQKLQVLRNELEIAGS